MVEHQDSLKTQMGDNIGMLLSNEYNLFDVIRYNVGLSKSQTILLEKDLKESIAY